MVRMSIFINTTMQDNLLFLILVGAVVAGVSAYLGSFMVVKRMALVGDALSHVALPGMALALVFGVSPMLGAFLSLIIAIVGIWYFSEHSSVYPEALVGIFFTFSLAVGILITPEPELLEALFGNIEKITVIEGIVAIAVSLLVLFVASLFAKRIMLGVVSEDLAKSMGVKVELVNLVYLLLVGAVVALGVKFVGSLLTGALVIIPASTAKNISVNSRSFHGFAIIIGVVSAILGILLGEVLSMPVGPTVVLVSSAIFLLSLAFRRK